jgi:hypothetical protein
MLAIKTKLGSSSNSLRQYSASRSLSIPDSMLEFDAWLNPTCECLTVYNEDGARNIVFQYYRCSDGNLASLNVAAGANRNVCVQNGTDIESDDIGLLTVVNCGTPCTTNANCTTCI